MFDTTLSPARVVAKHRSQIVSPEDAAGMTHLSLQRLYLEFAQESLAAAATDSPAGSQALVGIAKFYLVRAQTDGMKREGPRAVALCQAALVVDPNNHSAANELGALLAQYGRLKDAKQMLLNSLRSQPTIAAWHNLAVVHERLGETDLAQLARAELESLQKNQAMTARNVGWVDKQAFAETQPGPGGSDRAAFNAAAAPSQTAPPTQAQSPANNRWIR